MVRANSVALGLLLMAPIGAAASVPLVREGRPVATIVLPEKANAVEQLAAEELRDHIRQMSGAELPIATAPPAARPKVLIGRAAHSAGVSADDLPLEHYRIRTIGDALCLVGHDGRFGKGEPDPLDLKFSQVGTLFAVYHLLDHVFQVRWLWPGEEGTVVPRRSTVEVPALDVLSGPKMAQRQLRYGGTRREVRLWLRRHQMGCRQVFGFGHAFTQWWEKYGKTHPEYFAQLPGRQQPYPAPDRVKLCVSNPAVVEQIVKDWQASGAGPILRACPNDSRAYCTCERCRAWDLPVVTTPENVDESVLTYRYVRFWNAIAEKAVAINPDVVIYGYAYSNYREPRPGIRLHPNIALGIVAGSPLNPATKAEWQAWSEAGAKMLFLRPNWWHEGHLGPFLPLHAAAQFFQYAREHGMMGTDFDSLLGHWSTQGAYYYLIARLHERPDLSADQVIEEYASAFGRAAPAVRAYLDYWEKLTPAFEQSIREHVEDLGLGTSNRASVRVLPLVFTPEVLAGAQRLLEEAGRLAQEETPAVRARLQFLRDGLTHLRLTRDALEVADGAVTSSGVREAPRLAQVVRALRRFRQEHANDFVDNMEGCTDREIRVGDYTGLQATAALGDRIPVAALPTTWRLQWDPDQIGEKEQWFAEAFDVAKAGWLSARISRAWEMGRARSAWKEAHGRDPSGALWCRTAFTVPPATRGKTLRILFSAMDGASKMWLNGRLAAERTQTPTAQTAWEVPLQEGVRFDGPNTVVVRLEDHPGGIGMAGLVWLLAD